MIRAKCEAHGIELETLRAEPLRAFYVSHRLCRVDVKWDEADSREVEEAGRLSYEQISGREA